MKPVQLPNLLLFLFFCSFLVASALELSGSVFLWDMRTQGSSGVVCSPSTVAASPACHLPCSSSSSRRNSLTCSLPPRTSNAHLGSPWHPSATVPLPRGAAAAFPPVPAFTAAVPHGSRLPATTVSCLSFSSSAHTSSAGLSSILAGAGSGSGSGSPLLVAGDLAGSLRVFDVCSILRCATWLDLQ